MIKKYLILFILVLLLFGINNQNVFAEEEGSVSDCQSMADESDDETGGSVWPGWDSYCDTCSGISTCCGAGGPQCKCPCDVSYCLKDKCIKLDKICDYDKYVPGLTQHCHGCDWIKEDRSNWHGVPITNIDSPTAYNDWVTYGCCHYHSAAGSISGGGCGGMCLNYKLGFAIQNGSNICAVDADCKTTTTTKGSTVCKTGETNPHYTCDYVNSYDYKKGTYTGVYCVKKDWCGVTNCDTKYNKSEKKSMYIHGVWFKEAIYYYNTICKVCPIGQKNPHTECKAETTTYYNRLLHKNVNYKYYTCAKIDSCGSDKCDYNKNVSTGLGEYTEYDDYGKPYTLYDKYVSVSAECATTTTTTTSTTTTTTSTTTKPEKPGDGGGSNDRYVCDPKAIKIDDYGKCILDNSNKYPKATSCNVSNNKIKLINKPCSRPYVTCLAPVTYNTDCKENMPAPVPKPTTPTPSPVSCFINLLRFYDDKKDYEYVNAYSIFSKPINGILENPKLEYVATDCSTCSLTISPVVDSFIKDNPGIFGELIGELIPDFEDRYYFNKSVFNGESIVLNVTHLTPDVYSITLTCIDPVTKETEIKTLKLNIFQQLRWREVVPVIN